MSPVVDMTPRTLLLALHPVYILLQADGVKQTNLISGNKPRANNTKFYPNIAKDFPGSGFTFSSEKFVDMLPGNK